MVLFLMKYIERPEAGNKLWNTSMRFPSAGTCLPRPPGDISRHTRLFSDVANHALRGCLAIEVIEIGEGDPSP
jgi:hypothetical protein